MRGRVRIRKKHVAQAGWKILEDEARDDRHHLRLRAPDGGEHDVEGPSRPRAYRNAVVMIRGRTVPG